MERVPRPTRFLALLHDLDLDPALGPDGSRIMFQRDHAAAIARAAEHVGLLPAARVAARATMYEGEVKMYEHPAHGPGEGPALRPDMLAAAVALPLDGWHTDCGAAAVHVEFLYCARAPAVCLRVVTHLAEADGVLASRIAFHALEALEGAPLAPPLFKRNPPVAFTPRTAARFLRLVGGALLSALAHCSWALPRAPPLAPGAVAEPTSPAALVAYYRQPDPQPAAYAYFAPDHIAHRPFIQALAAWQRRTKRSGKFFALINFSPSVAPTLVDSAECLTSVAARSRGVFAPVGSPPPPPVWFAFNVLLADKLVFNNYGAHNGHSFRAVPRGFHWDWIGLAATVAVAGSITVNGRYFVYVRGPPDAVAAAVRHELAPALGAPARPTGTAIARPPPAPPRKAGRGWGVAVALGAAAAAAAAALLWDQKPAGLPSVVSAFAGLLAFSGPPPRLEGSS